MGAIYAERYHDISCGHRVVGHESKCKNLHGHNYRFHFTIKGGLDKLGRVIDFGVIKTVLCEWLEQNWDHKFLLWEKDSMWDIINLKMRQSDVESFIEFPYNPTAENIARYFVEEIAPVILKDAGYHHVELVKLKIEETRKCSAIYEKD